MTEVLSRSASLLPHPQTAPAPKSPPHSPASASTTASPSAWAPIPASNHEASDLGQIRHAKTKKILQATFDRDGYRIVNLLQGGSRRPHAVHRLVLLAFLGPPPSALHQAAHNDGDRASNNVWNLSWLTPAENGKERRRHNTIKSTMRAFPAAGARARHGSRIKVPSRFVSRCVGRIETNHYIHRVCRSLSLSLHQHSSPKEVISRTP